MTSKLETAYFCAQHPIHRVRYGEQCVVEKHVHVEALAVRDGPANQTLAKGIRFLLRSQPIEELPRGERRPSFEPPTESEFPRSWLDPVSEGPPCQQSLNVFVDLEDVPKLVEGVFHLAEASHRWPESGAYGPSEWAEAVFAWEEALVFGMIQRQATQVAFVESRTKPRMYFETSPHRLSTLRAWLKRAITDLQAAP